MSFAIINLDFGALCMNEKQKKNLPFFSYVVAVYNAEAFLTDCLSSIAQQTYKDFEVILIDDGSTDRSADIALGFAKSDPRFRYYRQENSGSSSAYNKGIELARGEYLVFLDNDDWNSPGTLSEAFAAIKETNADVVQFSIIEERQSSQNCLFLQQAEFKGPRQLERAAVDGLFNTLTHSGKAIRRSLFFTEDRVRFNGYARGADLFVIRKIICLSHIVAIAPRAEWHFNIRENSQSHAKIDPSISASFHRFGVDSVLGDIPFYKKNAADRDRPVFWELDNLAWDSFIAWCHATKKNGSYSRREVVRTARRLWGNRSVLFSSKKRRLGLLLMSFVPALLLWAKGS